MELPEGFHRAQALFSHTVFVSIGLHHYSTATGPFQNSANMVVIDKWIVTVILGATLRFFDHATQRNVLMGKTGCLMRMHLWCATQRRWGRSVWVRRI